MSSRFDSPRFAVLAVAMAAVLFLSVNVLANLRLGNFRLDATQGGAYTISKQIKPVFENIDEPITVHLYYSEALGAASPRHAALYRRVRELLEQYAKLSKGKITVMYENPEPFSDTEDRAVGFGLQAVPLGDTGEVAYFGLAATNATDDQQVIPFFNLEREQFVEYDLTKLIYSLSKPAQTKIGVMSSLPLAGGMSGGQMGMGGQETPPWAILGQITDFFDVRDLDMGVTEIPQDISLLMLVQPSNLTPATQFAIDQFVLRGGRVLAFVDPNPESSGAAGADDNLDGIKKLMAAWGVNLVDGKVAGDLDAAIKVNSNEGGDRPVVSDYVAWLQLGPQNFDRQDAIIGDTKQIDVGTAGLLEKIGNASTTVTPLIMTGTKSMRIDVQKVQGMPDIVGLLRDFKPSGNAEAIAVRISGAAKTAFPDGAPTKPAAAAGSAPADISLKTSKEPIQVVVVADTDMLTDRFWTQDSTFLGRRVMVPTADNANFVVDAIENLTGSPALSSLRGHGIQSRPFVLIEEIQRDAEIQFRAKEQALQGHLDELEKKINAIQLGEGSGGAVQLSDADRITIENYRSEILSTRHDLREVQAALRRDIDRLEAAIKFIDIAAVPLIFGTIMIIATLLRRRRRAAKT